MTSTSDIATDFAFFAKKYKTKFPMSFNEKKKRTCYNCDEDSHFANECPYEKRVDKPKFVKGVKPRLKPNPINERYKKNMGRAFVEAGCISDEEEEDEEEKEAVVAGLAFSKPGSLFTYDYSKDYSTKSSSPNDIGSSFMARTTHDDDSDDSPSSTTVGSCLMERETKVMESPPSLSSVLDDETENQDEMALLKELYKRFNILRQEVKNERCISQGLKQQTETFELDKLKDLETIEWAQLLAQELDDLKKELEVAHASLTRDLDHLEKANNLVKDELKKLGENHDLLQETYKKALGSMNDPIIAENATSSSTSFTCEHAKLVEEHVRVKEELSLYVETNTYLESLVTKYGLNYHQTDLACEQATILEENARLTKELAKFTTAKNKMGLDDLLSKQEILVTKYSRNWTKSPPRFLFCPEASRTPESRQRGALVGPDDMVARPGLAAPPYGVVASSALLRRLFAYIKPLHRKPLRRKPRYEKSSRAAAIAKPRSGGQESLFRHPAGRGSAPGRLLHRHRCHLHRHLHHRCCSHEEE
ncbi:hypothetical protein QYE76_051912 [Lolium multiflorum]|uniref:CCHC-type domain-containing protein n=1 Tax=Lolium multiflorum TaxID=4521 RepID=A0AAD8SUJ8_LOLMU|nr:hypothetical protein QYE76_051912 [Lolium multiflorum]